MLSSFSLAENDTKAILDNLFDEWSRLSNKFKENDKFKLELEKKEKAEYADKWRVVGDSYTIRKWFTSGLAKIMSTTARVGSEFSIVSILKRHSSQIFGLRHEIQD